MDFTLSTGIFNELFSVCSGGICGRFCGQKRFPPLTVGFPPALSGKRFLPYAVCIVTLTERFCNGFLSKQTLKFYGAIVKEVSKDFLDNF